MKESFYNIFSSLDLFSLSIFFYFTTGLVFLHIYIYIYMGSLEI
jgi:hypothetical protein